MGQRQASGCRREDQSRLQAIMMGGSFLWAGFGKQSHSKIQVKNDLELKGQYRMWQDNRRVKESFSESLGSQTENRSLFCLCWLHDCFSSFFELAASCCQLFFLISCLWSHVSHHSTLPIHPFYTNVKSGLLLPLLSSQRRCLCRQLGTIEGQKACFVLVVLRERQTKQMSRQRLILRRGK